jgi:cytochrome b
MALQDDVVRERDSGQVGKNVRPSSVRAPVEKASRVPVWDLPVRAFHWGSVALLVTLFVTAKLGGLLMQYHEIAGYAMLALVLFRLLWGVWGSDHARFSSFLYSPRTVWHYARTLFTSRSHFYLGHNPLGGLSVLLMLALLLIQAVSGLFANDDVMLEGPLARHVTRHLSDQLTSLHKFSFNILLVAIALHLAAVLFHLVFKRDNLVGPMLTGSKRVAVSGPPRRFASIWRAAATLAITVLFVFALISI